MKSFGNRVVALLEGLVTTSTLLPYQGDWVPAEHADRLQQYEVFRAVAENRFAKLLKDAEAKKKLREYGDYGLIVETSRDAVLGDRIDIEVPGAADEEDPGAVARMQLLSNWSERERWASKVYRAETDAATVGDSVYELRPAGTRLQLRTHDPESFFPVWENSEGDFSEAYLAWEEMNTGQYLPDFSGNLKDLRDRDGEVVLYLRRYRKVTMDEARALGVDVRGGSDRELVCIVTAGWHKVEAGSQDATGWERLKRLGFELTIDSLPIENLDTGFDEVPLFYVPNKEATGQPWGLPEGDSILQLLLDADQDYTDLKENTYQNAFPVMYDENPVTGPRPGGVGTPSEQKYKPGVIYNGRKLGTVDLSKGNDLLLKHAGFLIEKALTNSRTSPILAGVADAGQFPSGYAMMIALTPTFAKTLPKRQTRKDKLGMLLKHVLRWHRDWAEPADYGFEGGWPGATFDDLTAYPTFGSIVPIDKAQVAEIVKNLTMASAISDETAVLMLQMAGFPIEDAAEEVKRLQGAQAPATGAPGSGLGNEGEGEIVIPGLEGEEAA